MTKLLDAEIRQTTLVRADPEKVYDQLCQNVLQVEEKHLHF